MAVVRPFRAIRYARPAGADITSLTAPPYDVVSDAERQLLLDRDPHNVIALELAEGALDPGAPRNRYETAGVRWRAWNRDGVLALDPEPAFYVLEQRYEHEGRAVRRLGFLGAVDLEPFAAGVVLPHERTLPKATDDRLRMTRATAANLSPVFGLYADPQDHTGALLAQAMEADPLAVATGLDSVRSTLWSVREAKAQAALAGHLAAQRIYIADGHHRYTTALGYRDERRAAAARVVAPPAWDGVLMALVRLGDPGLLVWPTHRVADAAEPFDAQAFWRRLEEHFDVREAPGHGAAPGPAAAGDVSFVVRTRGGQTRLARLRPDIDHAAAFPPGTSPIWRSLDVAVLQELVLWPLLGIHPDQPATLERLSFTKDADEALAAAAEHDAAFVLNPPRLEQIAAVAEAGETMPQKSTYFHPKLPSGLVFRSLE